ncbi:right-handed parallel beta-helix repeat-containing protein [[Clostridium] fimetarium]|uniref:Right handed beta helix region n=1 Tax=[Clostridium] fimetarium TaxID=99656 RepID=A0A1I0NK66_9FIRM|nr:right-handed parallel beta-helix repeat-containing protein [[Clostridium] fimetarium]SEW01571.1 Right handed beta helix region [[Clostridium] fimetarium]
MKKKRRQRVIAVLMATLMIVGLIPTDFAVSIAKAATATTKFTLDTTSNLKAMAAGAATDGQELKAGTEDYFTLLMSAKTKIDSSSKTFADAYAATQRINFGAVGTTAMNSLKFTTAGSASVKIWWAEGGDDNRQMTIMNSAGTSVATTTDTLAKNAACISTLTLADAGTYYLGGVIGNNYIFKVEVEVTPPAPVEKISVIDTSSNLTAMAAGAATDGQELKAGTANYFTLLMSAKTKIDSSSKTFEDAYAATQRINFGAVGTTAMNSMKFTTEGTASVKIWWAEGGDDNRQMTILNSAGTSVATTTNTLAKNAACISTLTLADAGTYYLGSVIGNNYIFKVQVTDTIGGSVVKPERKAWADITAPTIGKISAVDGVVTVPFDMVVGYDGADKVNVIMKNASEEILDTKSSSKEGTNASVTFTPSASGDYHFSIAAVRADNADKVGIDSTFVGFSLPLAKASFSSATSIGGGKVALVWADVKEATAYDISYSTDGITFSTPVSVVGTTKDVSGLTIGTKYTFKVVATRGTDVSVAATVEATPTQQALRVWSYAAFGSGVDTTNNSFSGSVNTGDLRLWSLTGKGKIVPASTDGLAYYYTKIDPSQNFTLKAKVTVNAWTFSNGQEGFGLMAADAVGINGDASVFWNNSYMASVTKVDYGYDSTTGALYDTVNAGTALGGDMKVSMKLGVGAQEKTGATAGNIATGTITAANQTMSTLENSAYINSATTGNVVGKYTNTTPASATYNKGLTTFDLTITRNNTGYFISYTDELGKTNTKKYYDYNRTALTQIDANDIYVGFFASRNADISVSDVSLTTINPADDIAAEVPETTYVTPNYTVTSPTATGIVDYNLVFTGNANGVLTVKDPSGNVIIDAASVTAGTSVIAPTTTLSKGSNAFEVTFKPNDNYVPGSYQLLSSYDAVTFTHTVSYKTYGVTGQSIWVSPTGTSKDSGNKSNPMDIYTAVKYVQPGQTIVIMEGTYNLETTVKIARGINGTEASPITMVADSAATTRPVFNFGKLAAGMVLAGNYWTYKGFDVTNSQDFQKGIQLSGSNCTLDQVNTYYNGSTGIQVSRLLTTDLFENWPANNLILNCSSYGNADPGYEDADGFAAKLTVGEGNIFRGCIAHNNADDGWDLFAKVETGKIGKVVVENSVAYGNGYLEDGTNAGNGNGFKLGGSSITGYHELKNCISYNNKAKGIDSNSCPDIKVTNCTTYNNGSYNVALYTTDAKNTDFSANGIISYRTTNLTQVEQIKLLGTQDPTKINAENNFFWNGVDKSVNSLNVAVSANWFTSLDTSIVPTRDGDGSINMNGLLTLTSFAPATAGARLAATPSLTITIPTSVPAPKTGDSTPIYLFFTLSIMSGAALVGLYFYNKKRKFAK